tara:strand:+ start:2947 stop:3747 length:801 start_codon:yes stop_codon:yes gene_type:complete
MIKYKIKYFDCNQYGSSNIKKIENNYKIAIIIISANSERWNLEKQIWKKYIDKFPNITCFFIECNKKSDLMLLNDKNNDPNTLLFNCNESKIPGIYQKSLLCLKHIGNQYDFYIRTNLSTFIIFDLLNNYLQNIPQNKPIYTGGYIWGPKTHMFYPENDFASGTSIILNKLARDKIVKYGFEDKYFKDMKYADDIVFCRFFNDYDLKIFYNSENGQDLYFWNYKISFESNLKNIRSHNYPFLRLKTNDLNKYDEVSNKLLTEYYSI